MGVLLWLPDEVVIMSGAGSTIARMTGLVGRCLISSSSSLRQGRPLVSQFSTCRTRSQKEADNTSEEKNLGGFLHEFFDHPEHWGQERVRVGRAWSQPELRLKSNEDLHKLWYVLLKERNMLLTMDEAYQQECKEMPNPERIDKVDESMENVEYVVRERNRAFCELETGVSGEAERSVSTGPFGLPTGYTTLEHAIPWKLNAEYRKYLRYRYQTCNSPTVKKIRQEIRREEDGVGTRRQDGTDAFVCSDFATLSQRQG